MYRLHYGNGQVSDRIASKSEALRQYWRQRQYDADIGQSSAGLRIMRYEGDGEWSFLKNPTR